MVLGLSKKWIMGSERQDVIKMKNSTFKYLFRPIQVVNVLIIILLIVFISSCNCKMKEFVSLSTNLQRKIFFTIKKKGYTNIVKLNTKTKSKEIVCSIPFQPEDIVISSDQKKVAIATITETVGGNKYDIYTMNIDGSNQKNNTDALKIPKTYIVDQICFSPDNQHIAILISSRNQEKKNESLIYLIKLDETKTETFPADESSFTLMYQIFFEIQHSKNTANNALKHSYADYNGTIKYNPDNFEFLLHDQNNKSIGIYSWKERKFSPILNYTESIDDFSWTPDRKSILFTVKVDEKKIDKNPDEFYDVILYNISSKSITAIMSSVKIQFPSILWLPNEKSFIYLIKGSYFYGSLHDTFLENYNLSSMKTSKVAKSGDVTKLEMLTNDQIIVHELLVDGMGNSIFNLESQKFEEIQYPLQLSASGTVFSFNNQHILFSQYGFVGYDSMTKKINSQYLALKNNESLGSFIVGETLSPDQSNFYFVYKNKIFNFDLTGKLLFIELLTSSNFSYQNTDSSFLLGFFSSPSEITYLEYVNKGSEMTDLYQYDFANKKITNLTENVGELLDYQVSPDQQSVALLTKDFEKNLRELSIMNLSTATENPSKMIKIATFQPIIDEREDRYTKLNFSDEPMLLTMLWSKDSQWLYFTSNKVHEPDATDEANFKRNILSIHRVNKDGTGLIVLSGPERRSFFPTLSPDNQQMVFVANDDQLIKQMNSDGTNLHTFFETDPSSSRSSDVYFQPRWLLDNKTIAFILKASNEKNLKLMFLDEQEKLILSKDIMFQDRADYQPYELYKVLDMNHFCSPNKQLVAYHSLIDLKLNRFQAILLKDLKEEIPLKGNITDFRWSPSGNQLLLLESKELNQINQLTLYDCNTNTYSPISQDVQQIFDACWSPDGKQILYSGTDSKTGQIGFKTSNPDGSNQKVLFTFGENPLERPSSIEKVEKLVWLK
jgi:hypothetical protein